MEFFARCKCCKKEMPCTKTEEDPKNAIGCYVNFCPECEDKANDYLQTTSFIFPPKKSNPNNKNKDQLKLF